MKKAIIPVCKLLGLLLGARSTNKQTKKCCQLESDSIFNKH